MTELIIALLVLTVVCTAVLAAMPWLLRRRGVDMLRTKFGLTLVFDSQNADGTPVRLLNVNGTFQSGCYVPEDLRFQLACEYHREMARVIGRLVRERDRTAEAPLRVLVMGGGGYSLPKYLAAYVPEARVDVVEIDPAITALAREFFFLDECLEKTGAEKDGRHGGSPGNGVGRPGRARARDNGSLRGGNDAARRRCALRVRHHPARRGRRALRGGHHPALCRCPLRGGHDPAHGRWRG